MLLQEDQSTLLSEQAIQAFDDVSGHHPGYRPTHAKGILLTGTFFASPGARLISRAPHLNRDATPVSVRFSNFGGIPSIPDNDPNAAPRGIAIRFHLAEHVHTDILAHSVNGFPARTAEEFVDFLRAIAASRVNATRPTPIEAFLAAHPAALRFVQAPKPVPPSFAAETFFSVSAYRFINRNGEEQYGRYQILPVEDSSYLSAEDAASKSRSFLFEEIRQRLLNRPVQFHVVLQLSQEGDTVDDSTTQWPDDRPLCKLGTLEIQSIAENEEAQQQHIIFDPIPRVDGIDPSGDPLLEPRAAVYLMSGRRRRKQGHSAETTEQGGGRQ